MRIIRSTSVYVVSNCNYKWTFNTFADKETSITYNLEVEVFANSFHVSLSIQRVTEFRYKFDQSLIIVFDYFKADSSVS